MSSSDIKETAQQAIDGPKQFFKEGVQFINGCKKPDQQGNQRRKKKYSLAHLWHLYIEFLKITQAVAMGFAALGALGYLVKVSLWYNKREIKEI